MPANALYEIRRIAGYVDAQFHPQLQELPALFAALVHRLEHGDNLTDVIAQAEGDARQLGQAAVGNEVHEAVSRLLSPPPEDPQSDYQVELGRIRDEQQQLLDRLRADSEQVQNQLNELRNVQAGSGAAVPAPDTPPQPPTTPDVAPPADVPPAADPTAPAPAGDPIKDPGQAADAQATTATPQPGVENPTPPPIAGASPELDELQAAQAAYERAAIRVAQLAATTVTHETGPGA